SMTTVESDSRGGAPTARPRGRGHLQNPARRGRQRDRPRVDRHLVAATAFLSPVVILIGAFVLVPMLLTFWISLHTGAIATPLSELKWAGLDNYRQVFTDPIHRQAFANTAI